jgi:glycosyltransferase involved in cell wall biosynthesis
LVSVLIEEAGMGLPTLSVIVANYNHARYLPTALRCILEQSVQPLEVLVIDDGSTDNSIAVVEEIARREVRVELLPNKRNRGVTYTFNRGLALARGEYVYGAAADDQLLPGFFAETLAMAAEHPQAGILFGDVVQADDAGKQLAYFGLSGRKERTYFTPKSFLDDYLAVEPPGHSLCGATIYRRDRLLEMGGYRDGLGSWVDTFVTRAIGLKYGACYIPKPFMQWRYAANSLANGTTTWQALKIVKKAGRQMRSRQFRDCFPDSYVRRWEEGFGSYLLRQHLSRISERREANLQAAQQNEQLNPFALERELHAEERYLYRRLDPVLRNAWFPRRFCESVVLPSRRVPPLRASDMESDGGHGFRVDLDRLGIFVSSDQESISLLRLYEDKKPLPRPHHTHEEIRTLGAGRYSHWGNFLHFAASDNSDPRTNGRKYVVEAPRTLFSCARSLFRPHRAA